jgi:hypothetical protein
MSVLDFWKEGELTEEKLNQILISKIENVKTVERHLLEYNAMYSIEIHPYVSEEHFASIIRF